MVHVLGTASMWTMIWLWCVGCGGCMVVIVVILWVERPIAGIGGKISKKGWILIGYYYVRNYHTVIVVVRTIIYASPRPHHSPLTTDARNQKITMLTRLRTVEAFTDLMRYARFKDKLSTTVNTEIL